ncbi:hypothetical protein [Qipengyuania flava]|uniref:hypothetical protein n=1 Tax=Qipengyuania flava TaxID=192812 RepID=UPI00321A23D3
MGLNVIDPKSATPRLTGVFSSDENVDFVSSFKLLAGMADIEDTLYGRVHKCRKDYRTLSVTHVSAISEEAIAKGLFGDEISAGDAREIISKLRYKNVGFFKNFLQDLTLCFAFHSKNHSVDRFLYFYRVVEYVAIAFPIYYFSKRSDFVRSHGLLKDFFSGKDDGELRAIKKLSSFFAEQSADLSALTIDLRVSGDYHPDHANEVVEQIFNRLDAEAKENAETGEYYVKMRYSDVGPFIIASRNLLFHNSNSGQKNFRLDRMGGAEALCDALFPAGLIWLTQTYLEIIRDRAAAI